MRTKCGRRDKVQFGPIEGPEQAVEALRLSASRADEECIVVLVCDEKREVVLALDFIGAPVVGAPQVMELMAAALAAHGSSAVVVGLFNGEPDAYVVDEVEAICFAEGIRLLDVLVVEGDRWRSVREA